MGRFRNAIKKKILTHYSGKSNNTQISNSAKKYTKKLILKDQLHVCMYVWYLHVIINSHYLVKAIPSYVNKFKYVKEESKQTYLMTIVDKSLYTYILNSIFNDKTCSQDKIFHNGHHLCFILNIFVDEFDCNL